MDLLLFFANPLFGRLRFCAKIGAIAGLITGSFFGLVLWQNNALPFTTIEAVKVGILLGIAAWLYILLSVGIWMRYGLLAIAARSLANALLTSLVTVLICNKVLVPALCFIIGLLAGIIIGTLFCYLCTAGSKKNK